MKGGSWNLHYISAISPEIFFNISKKSEHGKDSFGREKKLNDQHFLLEKAFDYSCAKIISLESPKQEQEDNKTEILNIENSEAFTFYMCAFSLLSLSACYFHSKCHQVNHEEMVKHENLTVIIIPMLCLNAI